MLHAHSMSLCHILKCLMPFLRRMCRTMRNPLSRQRILLRQLFIHQRIIPVQSTSLNPHRSIHCIRKIPRPNQMSQEENRQMLNCPPTASAPYSASEVVPCPKDDTSLSNCNNQQQQQQPNKMSTDKDESTQLKIDKIVLNSLFIELRSVSNGRRFIQFALQDAEGYNNNKHNNKNNSNNKSRGR